MCCHGTRSGILWTQDHSMSESKCTNDTWSTKTTKYQPFKVISRYDKLPKIPTKTVNYTSTLTLTVYQEWTTELVSWTRPNILQKQGVADIGYTVGTLKQYQGLVLACDTSPQEIGSVIPDIMEDGKEKSIAHNSCILAAAAAEKNYTQINKDGLMVVNSIKEFHQILYG